MKNQTIEKKRKKEDNRDRKLLFGTKREGSKRIGMLNVCCVADVIFMKQRGELQKINNEDGVENERFIYAQSYRPT